MVPPRMSNDMAWLPLPPKRRAASAPRRSHEPDRLVKFYRGPAQPAIACPERKEGPAREGEAGKRRRLRCLFGRGGGDPDRAADAGAAQPAIAVRVLGQVLLVIILGVVEGPGLGDLRGDRAIARRRQPLLIAVAGLLGRAALRRREGIDGGAVLRAHVIALAHALGGIMALPEG